MRPLASPITTVLLDILLLITLTTLVATLLSPSLCVLVLHLTSQRGSVTWAVSRGAILCLWTDHHIFISLIYRDWFVGWVTWNMRFFSMLEIGAKVTIKSLRWGRNCVHYYVVKWGLSKRGLSIVIRFYSSKRLIQVSFHPTRIPNS